MDRKQINHIAPGKLQPHPANAELYGFGLPEEKFIESVRLNGVLDPLTVETKSMMILSGHRRHAAAIATAQKTVPVILVAVADPDEQLNLLIELNRQREKTVEQRAREFQALKEVEARLANARVLAGKKTKEPTLGNGNPQGQKGKSRDIAAEKVGLSGKTAEKAAKVVSKIDELYGDGETEQAEDLRQTLNEESVAAAHRKISEPPPADTPVETEPSTPKPPTKWLDDLIRRIGALDKEFSLLRDAKPLIFGTEFALERIQEFHLKAEALRNVLRAARMTEICPYCNGKKCDRCKSSGWLPKYLADAAPRQES